jgi:hypothetical protein
MQYQLAGGSTKEDDDSPLKTKSLFISSLIHFCEAQPRLARAL